MDDVGTMTKAGDHPAVYLAARYSRRTELLEVRADLEGMGFVVTSRWLDGDHQAEDLTEPAFEEGTSPEEMAAYRLRSAQAAEGERVRFATEDLEDLLAARVCISFTETPRMTKTRGGRHVEFGVALHAGHLMLVVGPRENVFHCLPPVRRFDTWAECRAFLLGRFG